jgi:hypothetical protein
VLIRFFDRSFTFAILERLMKSFIAVVFLVVSVSFVQAQNQDSVFIRRIADETLLHGTAYENLRILTKQIGARLTGSPQMPKAEQWGAKALRVAGADAVWLQECMVPHWVRGGKDAASAFYKKTNKKSLAITALGNSVGTLKLLTCY